MLREIVVPVVVVVAAAAAAAVVVNLTARNKLLYEAYYLDLFC